MDLPLNNKPAIPPKPTAVLGASTDVTTITSDVTDVPVHPKQMMSDTLVLDLTHDFSPFNLPLLEEIICQVKEVFPDDTGLTLQTLKGRGTGLYRIILSTPIGDLTDSNVTFRRKDKSGEDKNITVTLTHFVPDPSRSSMPMPRRDGVLVTIVNARVGAARPMANSLFDDVLKEHGVIVKPTEFQLYKGTPMFNGNRYAVIAPENRGTIPGTISVFNTVLNRTMQFFIRYKGQQWHCRRCDELHCGPCPELAEFYEAKKARERITVPTKIIADSSLRRADAVGLKADVLCMSGAGYGELANVLHDDPTLDDKPFIFVVGGKINEIKNYDYPDLNSFLTGVHVGLNKLQREMAQRPDAHLTIVTLNEPPEGLPYEERVRDLCVSQMLVNLQENGQISLLPIPPGTVEKDPSGHPSLEGTRTILNIIDEAMGNALIFNAKYSVNPRFYMGVQPVFKYGCKRCDKFGQYPNTAGLCPLCLESVDPPDFTAMVDTIRLLAEKLEPNFEEDFPPLNGAIDLTAKASESEGEPVIPAGDEGHTEPPGQIEVSEPSNVSEPSDVNEPPGQPAVSDNTAAQVPPVPPKRHLTGNEVDKDDDKSTKFIKTDLHANGGSTMSDDA